MVILVRTSAFLTKKYFFNKQGLGSDFYFEKKRTTFVSARITKVLF